ncbi:MAG: tRNA nucleotidyltransferase, partial [Oscillospiraceae bacterium]|nr:tRNA nucleotidyltransferase [Oscillospiraceae bacterium]
KKHGTVGVILTGQMYEITTFRTEGDYTDARHPDWVEFVTDIRQDLARRDFTVNAIAYAPSTGFVDPYGGEKDLGTKTLRAVGDAEARFQEDALRILRGIRFSVRFGFTPEDHTLAAMLRCAPLIDMLAKERISSELCKLLPLITQEDVLRYKAVFCRIVNELSSSGDPNQYARTAAVIGAVSRELPLRMAALLHTLDEETANRVLLRLRTSNSLRSQTLRLLQLNVTPMPTEKKQLRQLLGDYGEGTVQQLLCLQKAIAAAEGQNMATLDTAELLLNAIHQDGGCLTVKDLAITGSDLLALGVEPGPQIGRCMQSLLGLVQEDILLNEKEDLLAAAKDFFEL